MVKRPLGLKKSSKTKRAKVDLPNTDGDPDNNDQEQQKAQIELDVDPDDELGQLVALYDSYLKDQSGNQQKLLYGVVNESDRLLREAADKEETDKLPSKFHNIYALALLGLSKYADLDDSEEGSEKFVQAAIDRANVGLENEKEQSMELLFTRAKALIELVEVKLKMAAAENNDLYKLAAKLIDTVEKAIQDYENAESLVISDENNKYLYTQDQLDTIGALLELGDGFGELEDAKQKGKLDGLKERYTEWSKKRWEQILDNITVGKGKGKSPAEDGDHSYAVIRRANRGLGEYYLALANQHISVGDSSDDSDGDEEEDDDEKKEEESEDDKKARALLKTALEHLLQAEDDDNDQEGTIYPIIAEAQIELANLTENESKEQELLYGEAAMRLKKAQRLGVGDYTEQIEEIMDM